MKELFLRIKEGIPLFRGLCGTNRHNFCKMENEQANSVGTAAREYFSITLQAYRRDHIELLGTDETLMDLSIMRNSGREWVWTDENLLLKINSWLMHNKSYNAE